MPQREADEVCLRRLVADSGLPPVRTSASLDEVGYGLDNRLIHAELADGRLVLLRRTRTHPALPAERRRPPRPRVDLLRAAGVPVPQLYAADEDGNGLWEFVPGRPLADLVRDGAVSGRDWHRVGAMFAAVHAVVFPAGLQGPIEADQLRLRPLDPVDQLLGQLAAARPWMVERLPSVVSSADFVARFVRARAAAFRAERPTVCHGDVNLLNIIIGADSARLIDWDVPVVRYPLAELAALEEHAFLHGAEALPDSFYTGYRRPVDRDLMLVHRVVGNLHWLSSADWSHGDADVGLPATARERLHHWHERLLRWAQTVPELLGRLD